MVRVRLKDDGPANYSNRNGTVVDQDEPVVDVDRSEARYLVEQTDYFEFEDPDPRLETATEETREHEETDETRKLPDEFTFDDGALLSEVTATEAADRIRTGDYDDLLDELEAAADRKTVTDVIETRRD